MVEFREFETSKRGKSGVETIGEWKLLNGRTLTLTCVEAELYSISIQKNIGERVSQLDAYLDSLEEAIKYGTGAANDEDPEGYLISVCEDYDIQEYK